MKKENTKPIRVLIADDSSVGRRLLAGILSEDPMIEVVAMATDGKEALELTIKHRPDVVSMDINMPVMDGIEATKRIMSMCPVPVIIVSSIYRDTDVLTAIRELEAGAVMVLPKPHGPGHETFESSAIKYINSVKLMAEVKVVRRSDNGKSYNLDIRKTISSIGETCKINLNAKIVVIGASAGGPEALKSLLSEISPDFPLPILLVQHIDQNFIQGFTTWINTFSNIEAVIAKHGERPTSGKLYIPPPDSHIIIENGVISTKADNHTDSLHKPSVDVLFQSIVKYYGENSVGIILSGMGKDGAVGLKMMKDAGAFTFIQDISSALIYGMPGEALKLGAACAVLTPDEIAKKLNHIYTK
jgi:two-component system chemotaxis response regulator CheB